MMVILLPIYYKRVTKIATRILEMENLKWQHAMTVKNFYEPWA